MKTVIKEGNIKEVKKACLCYRCKTKFSFQSEDIEFDRDGAYVTCPKCGVFNEAS